MPAIRRTLRAIESKLDPISEGLEGANLVTRIVEHLPRIAGVFGPDSHAHLALSLVLLPAFIAFEFCARQMRRENPILLNLNTAALPTGFVAGNNPDCGRLIGELNYFERFMSLVNRSQPGDAIISLISPAKAGRLIAPVGNFLQKYAERCGALALNPAYIFEFHESEIIAFSEDDLRAFFSLYSFAHLSVVILNDDVIKRYGVPNHGRRNIALFPNQELAMSHFRDAAKGTMSIARIHEGKGYLRKWRIVEKVKFLGKPLDETMMHRSSLIR